MQISNILVSILDQNQRARKGTKDELSDEAIAGTLSLVGINYDTKEYFDYYERHSDDYYEGDDFVPTDGKVKLINEHMAGLEYKSGYMRVMDRKPPQVGNNPFISGTNEYGDADIHTHTSEGRRFRSGGRNGSVGTGKAALGNFQNGDLQRGSHEIPGDERYRSGIFNVVVSPTHVHLYRHGAVVISVSRNSNVSRNPSEIR